MNVVVVTPWYPGADRPWEGTFIRNKVEALRDLGIGIRIVKLTSRPPYAVGYEIDPATQAATSKRRVVLGSRHLASLVRRQVLPTGPGDVVIAESAWTITMLRAAKLPVVGVLHGREPMTFSGSRTDPLSRRVIAASLRRCDALVAVGPPVLADLPEDLRRHTTVIPNGVALDAFPARTLAVIDRMAAADFPHLVSVGNVTTNKNQETVLHAFRELRRTWPHASWTVVGDGPQRATLQRRCAEWGLSEHVRFTGRIAPTDVSAILRTADLFLLPSILESYGCAYVEAMAVGVPTLMPRGSGVAAYAGDARYLHDPTSVREIVAKAQHILSSPAQYAEAVAFGQRLAREHTWHANAASFVQVLESCLSRKEAVTT